MKRLITIAFIGFIFGLFNLSLFRSEKQQTDWAIGNFAEPLIFILATITVLLTVLTVIYIIQIKLKAKPDHPSDPALLNMCVLNVFNYYFCESIAGCFPH